MIKCVVCRRAPATDSVVQLEWEKLESVSVSASENRSTSYQMELSLVSKLTHCLNMQQKQNLTHYEDPPVRTVRGKVPDKDSNHIYCPQLALNLVEKKIHLQKKKNACSTTSRLRWSKLTSSNVFTCQLCAKRLTYIQKKIALVQPQVWEISDVNCCTHCQPVSPPPHRLVPTTGWTAEVLYHMLD